MKIEATTKQDYDQILSELTQFWGERGATLRPVHHPIYLYEFGDTAFVIRENEKVIAYLFGFVASTSKTGYVHLIAVRDGYRKKGLAGKLYQHFIEAVRGRGCTKVKAITQSENQTSIQFHRAIGMNLLGEPNQEGVPVVRDYRGPGEHRVVFEMPLN